MSALLRSGDIKDYTALGQDGQAVYTVATQLRDAIRFKRGRMFADYLAVPQRNDVGSTIDWYVPFESENPDGTYYIIPWSSATDEEKEKALTELDVFKTNMLELGKDLARSDSLKGDQLLFSRLLYTDNVAEAEQLKAIRFPNEEHIYLVNDRPVITFWGFIEKNQSPFADPFLCLRPQEPKAVTTIADDLPVEPTPVAESKPRKSLWWLWLLLLLLLAGLLFYFLKPYFFPEEKNVVTPAIETKDSYVSEGKSEVKKAECKDPVTYYKVNGVLRDKDGKIKLLPRTCDIIVADAAKYPFRLENGKWVRVSDGTLVTDTTILRNLNEKLDAETLATAERNAQSAVENSGVLSSDNTLNATTSDLTDKTVDQLAQQNVSDLQNNSAQNNNAQNANEQGNKTQQSANLPPVDPNMNQATGNQVVDPNAVAQGQKNVPNGQNPNTSTAKNLTLDPTALSQGKTDFLDGNWNAGAGIQDKATGKPLKLSYDFDKNGQGKVTLRRGDGVSCTGNVNAAVSGSGVNINNTGSATCSDGSNYQLPSVVCKPTTSGQADCSGSYGGGQSFPMSMKTE